MRFETWLLEMIDSMNLMNDVDDNVVVVDDGLIEISAHWHLDGNRTTRDYSLMDDQDDVKSDLICRVMMIYDENVDHSVQSLPIGFHWVLVMMMMIDLCEDENPLVIEHLVPLL